MEKNKKPASSGKASHKAGAFFALLLTAISLSACVVAEDHGGWNRHHHWNDDGDWQGGPGWQGDDGNWHRRH